VAAASSLKAREIKTIQSEANYEITIYGGARHYDQAVAEGLHLARQHTDKSSQLPCAGVACRRYRQGTTVLLCAIRPAFAKAMVSGRFWILFFGDGHGLWRVLLAD